MHRASAADRQMQKPEVSTDEWRDYVLHVCDGADAGHVAIMACYRFWLGMASAVQPPIQDPPLPAKWVFDNVELTALLRGYAMGAMVAADVWAPAEQRHAFWYRMARATHQHVFRDEDGIMRFRAFLDPIPWP